MPENNEALSEVYFYNSRYGDRKYNADSMTEWLLPFFTTGVFNGGLQVTSNGNMTVTVQPGHVNIGGKTRRLKAPTTLDLEVASGTLKRIDNVVVRRDDVARDIYLIVQTGGLAANPVPPPLVRENGIYDLKLAEVYITNGTISITQANITDTRMIKAVCGWVTATVTEMDFTQIQAQFNAFFAEYKPRIEADYNAYVQSILVYKTKFEQDTLTQYEDYETFIKLYKQYVITQYNAFIDYLTGYKTDSTDAYNALLVWFNSFKVDSQADFQAWFDTIQGILGTDEAGNLLNLIQQLQARQPSAQLEFDSTYGVDGYGLSTFGGGDKINVSNNFERYPQCTMYRVPFAYGVNGYGVGNFGGGDLVTVPAEFALSERNSIAVKTLPEYAKCTLIQHIGDSIYSLYDSDPNATESLMLILY